MTDAINAIYGVNDYLKNLLATNGFSGINIYPGRFAPEATPDNFITYIVRPYTDSDFFMVHTDSIRYRIYNTSFDSLLKIENLILFHFNVDDFYTVLSEPGIKYMQAHARLNDTDEAVFIEGNDYYYAELDIELIYTVIS